ncbi:MAG: hypothetical protein ACYC6G_18795 [Desulfobaccales bacterium]
MAKLFKLKPRKILTILAFALVLCGAFALSAQANYLDFTLGFDDPASAIISYAGGDGPLSGANIDVSFVQGEGTASHDGEILLITGGVISFTTGNYSGGGTQEWDFGSGGSFKITGGIAALGIADGTTLVEGSFDSATVYAAGAIFKIAFGDITDTKNPCLVTYFGYDADQVFEGLMNLSFFVTVSPPGAFSSTGISIGSGDLANTPVPIPPTMLLLGTGLLGLGLIPRRKKAVE